MALTLPTCCQCWSTLPSSSRTWAHLPEKLLQWLLMQPSGQNWAMPCRLGTALPAAVVKAVRVLMAQLKMLRMDAANFRLKMLAQTLKDGAGIRYRLLQYPSCRSTHQAMSHLQYECTCHLVLRSLYSLVLCSAHVSLALQQLSAVRDCVHCGNCTRLLAHSLLQ